MSACGDCHGTGTFLMGRNGDYSGRMEKYYKDLLKMSAVKSTKNPDGTGTITESTVNEIHKVLRSCFRQAVKWDMMEKNPAVDATVPKAKKQEREIWTAEMLMQALEACDNKMLKIAFHLAFTATLRIGEVLGLTWDAMDISEEAIAANRAYVYINKEVAACIETGSGRAEFQGYHTDISKSEKK